MTALGIDMIASAHYDKLRELRPASPTPQPREHLHHGRRAAGRWQRLPSRSPTLLSMLTSLRAGLLMLLFGLAVMAPVASAQDDEVIVDPDSPSGKEYELPIDRAREQAAASTPKPASAAGARSAPLFGEGVEPAGAGTRAAQGTRAMGGGPRGGSSGAAGANRADRATVAAAAERTAQAAAPGGASGLVAIIAAGGGVLLVGGLVGLLLRRRAAR